MKNNDVDEILIQFDTFFEFLMLDEAELEKKRQDLIKVGAIEEVNGQERVLLRKCAKWVLDELDRLSTKATMSRSHEDIMDYTFDSLGYLRVWHSFLSCLGPPNDPLSQIMPNNSLKRELNRALDDYHKIYKHLLTALEISFGINLSKNRDDKPEERALNPSNLSVDGWDKEQLIEDEDCATMAITLESFTDMLKLSGSEMVQRHQNLTEKVEIANINGKEHVLFTRYGIYVLDDLEYLRLRTETFRSDKAQEDYAFFSFQYLHIWTHLLLGRLKFETPSADKAPDDFIQSGWKNALDCFQAIYRYARNAIVISLENGLLASSKG